MRVHSFADRVYAIVRQVPKGRVTTYGGIASVLGYPRQARQVGWALSATPTRNPPIPAHRVINCRGELSAAPAFGGHDALRARLEAEGIMFLADGRVDLDRHLWLPDDENKKAANHPRPGSQFRRPDADG